MIDGSFDGMLLVDRSGEILIANAAFCNRLGYDRQGVVGTPLDQYVPEAAREGHSHFMEEWWAWPRPRMMGGPTDIGVMNAKGEEVSVEAGLGVGYTRLRTYLIVTVRWAEVSDVCGSN